jgi:hypothetical protein
MRFLTFFTPDPSAHPGPPSKEYKDEMKKLIEEWTKSGALLATGRLTPLQDGARVKQASGKITVTDGPYIESTEVIAGFALFELPSMEAAVESSKAILKIAEGGHITIRPLMAPAETCTEEPEHAAQSAH